MATRSVPRGRWLAALGLAALACPSLALGAAGQWSKLSQDGVQGVMAPSVAVDGANAVAAWVRIASGPQFAEAATFKPVLQAAGRSATVAGIANPWGGVGAPVLFGKPGGGLQALLAGGHGGNGDPLNGTSFAARNPDGSFAAPTPVLPGSPAINGSAVSAVLGPDGATPFFVNSYGGGAVMSRGGPPAATATDILAATGNPGPATGLNLGRDTTGRLWLAWYRFTNQNAGVVMLQIDPASGGPVGAPTLAPSSSTGTNNVLRVALACGQICRVVYHETGANGTPTNRLLSWAPGEAAPAVVSSSGPPQQQIAAAATSDNRVWTVWWDNSGKGEYKAVLGDARGAGGQPVSLGQPTAQGLPSNLAAATTGATLVVAANWLQTSGPATNAVFADVISPPASLNVPDTSGIPSPQVLRNGPGLLVSPKRVSLRALRKAKCVNVRVQTTRPARIGVAIFSGIRSIRVFGRATVSFTAPGKRLVCIRVPLRAHTFDVRQPYRFAFAVQEGAKPRKGEGKPREVSQVFRVLK